MERKEAVYAEQIKEAGSQRNLLVATIICADNDEVVVSPRYPSSSNYSEVCCPHSQSLLGDQKGPGKRLKDWLNEKAWAPSTDRSGAGPASWALGLS